MNRLMTSEDCICLHSNGQEPDQRYHSLNKRAHFQGKQLQFLFGLPSRLLKEEFDPIKERNFLSLRE